MKRIYMMLYGEPGVGKSVFACKAPKPFFITTDGNYEWLEEFGADPTAYKQVSSWEEAKKVFSSNFDNYETIVVDLLEDLFKWCEQEFCIKNRIDHISDIGYGKGYDITRNEFFIEISKLLTKNKNVILISHGVTETVKDRRGVEHTRYKPSSRLPDKVLDMIEGRLRYVLRCYLKADESEDGKLIKNRYLSLVPKENEFGIIRGVNENTIPHDIPLDWDEFINTINFKPTVTAESSVKTKKPIESNIIIEKVETKLQPEVIENQISIEELDQPVSAGRQTDMVITDDGLSNIKEKSDERSELEPIVSPDEQETGVISEEEVKPAVEPSNPTVVDGNDKIAAIKAKLAAMKNQNK